MNYSLMEIARICGGDFSGQDSRVGSVMTDSRHSFAPEEEPLFVAMRGVNHDGHRFIGDLYRRGVRAFLVEREVDAAEYPGAGFVRAGRSLWALQALASDYRGRYRGLMVGITGSAGKTTVKELLARAVPEGKTVFRSPRSYNSQLGVPLSVLMMGGDEDMAVIEAGISRPGEMERLSAIIRPGAGIFTGLGPQHGESFESDLQKACEKSKLFVACRTIIYDGSPAVREVLSAKIPAAELVDASAYVDREVFPDEDMARSAALVTAFYASQGIPAAETAVRLRGAGDVFTKFDMREGLAGSVIVADDDNTDVNSLSPALDYMRRAAAGKPLTVIMSDIMFSSLPAGEVYGRTASAVNAAGVEKFVGIGEDIYAHRNLFGPEATFHRTADEFLAGFRQSDITGHAVLVKGNPAAGFRKIVHGLERRTHTTVLEIDLDAIIHNLNVFRSRLSHGTRVMAMVKAYGYGNGGFEIAGALAGQGVDYLAVAFADEGVRLREQGITAPIVVLNADADSFGLMAANRLEPEIYNMASFKAFVAVAREDSSGNYPIHIKIDSGMHRLGFEEKDIPELLEALRREGNAVKVRSVFSHLAAADMPGEDDFTRGQIEAFDRISRRIAGSLGYEPLRHIANSAGAERFPQAEYDMVRLGIGLYGIGTAEDCGLRNVSRLVSRIVQVRELAPGETVGYGRTGKITRPMRLAVVPVGYADGLDRRLGEGRWSVEAGGRACPTVGRISMDSCMVDITDTDAREGDEAVVFGSREGCTVEDMARVLGTIPYEIMTSVPERVKRIFIKE